MATSGGLFESSDCSLWRAALASYPSVLERKGAESRSKKSKSKVEDLLQLDLWYQHTLPELISSREKPHLTHAELIKLMKWKLTRGKFRPRLTELVQQNQPDEVEKVTQEAFEMLPKLEAAVKHLCKLKAVGPATASAVLCAFSPQLAPFMADESVLSIPGLGKLEYNIKHYMAYAVKTREKVKELNELEKAKTAKIWTAHNVELALWTYYFAQKYDIEISEANKSESENTETNPSELPPPPKRMKKDTSH